ncbi:MAG TPA: VCBS repeat-containing protein, partial [Bryobacteraceae bacterium]
MLPLLAVGAASLVTGFRASFHDIAPAAGLTGKNISGGLLRKDYILETTGNGAAIFDYDGDGRNDIFIATGTRLKNQPDGHGLPQLYRNDGNGRFTDVAA